MSAGTYLRALARDLGERLGVGAHLVALRREAIGPDPGRGGGAAGRRCRAGATCGPRARCSGTCRPLELDEAGRRDVLHGRAVEAAGRRGSGADVALLLGRRAGRGGARKPKGCSSRRVVLGDALMHLPRAARGSTVTVGSFDGVHLGHQAVLRGDRAAGGATPGGRACW